MFLQECEQPGVLRLEFFYRKRLPFNPLRNLDPEIPADKSAYHDSHHTPEPDSDDPSQLECRVVRNQDRADQTNGNVKFEKMLHRAEGCKKSDSFSRGVDDHANENQSTADDSVEVPDRS